MAETSLVEKYKAQGLPMSLALERFLITEETSIIARYVGGPLVPGVVQGASLRRALTRGYETAIGRSQISPKNQDRYDALCAERGARMRARPGIRLVLSQSVIERLTGDSETLSMIDEVASNSSLWVVPSELWTHPLGHHSFAVFEDRFGRFSVFGSNPVGSYQGYGPDAEAYLALSESRHDSGIMQPEEAAPYIAELARQAIGGPRI